MTDESGAGSLRPLWTLVAALGTAGTAACVATICASVMRLVSITSASGGEPPDALIAAVPASLLSCVAFVVIQKAGSARAGGFDALGMLWIGLFGGLGAVLVVGRHSMPAAAQTVLLVIGFVFLAMALAALVLIIVASMPGGPRITTGDLFGSRPSGGLLYVVLNTIAAASGVAAGLALVAALEG